MAKKKKTQKKSSKAISVRMFEFNEGSSDKFWSIELSGKSHTVRYGRVGTAGQTNTKQFSDNAKALASYEKLIDQKAKKGYREVSTSQSRSEKARAQTAQQKQHEPFLKAIADDVSNPDPYAVYGDWLQEQGDPRGELIRVQLQLENEGITAQQRNSLRKIESSLLRKHSQLWLGDLSPFLVDKRRKKSWGYLYDDAYEYSFSRGFLNSVTVGSLLPSFVRAFCASPTVSTLRKLVLRFVPNEDTVSFDEFAEYESEVFEDGVNPCFHFLRKLKFECLQHFEIAARGRGCHTLGTGVELLVRRMPRLEVLHLEARHVDTDLLFKAKMPNLRSLTVHHISHYPLEILAKNRSLANLEYLACWPHWIHEDDDEGYISYEGFRAICRSRHLKNLQHISLRSSELGDRGIEQLVKTDMLNQLRIIELKQGRVTDDGAELLAQQNLSGLEVIDLSGNYLSNSGVNSLKAACKRDNVKLTVKPQLHGDPDDPDGEKEYLWYGDME